MNYHITHFYPGGTRENYEASIAAVHPARDVLPKGQIFHAAGPVEGGWLITAIHDSKESWEQFRDGVLFATISKGIKGGFPTPPTEVGFSIHNMINPR